MQLILGSLLSLSTSYGMLEMTLPVIERSKSSSPPPLPPGSGQLVPPNNRPCNYRCNYSILLDN